MSNYTNVYNQLVALAQKRDRDQITAKEWNALVGTLALQLNTMGANLDVVHEQLNNISELDEVAIADIMGRLIAIEEHIESLPIGEDGVGITSIIVDGNGEMIVTYTNGEMENLGVVKGADGKDGSSASIPISVEEPLDKTKDNLWFKIIS